MAVNLTAVFRMQDRGTAQIRRITQMTDRMSSVMRATTSTMNRTQQAIGQVTRATTTATTAMGRTQQATSRVGSTFRTANSNVNQFTQSTRSASNASSSLVGNLGKAKSALLGIAGAYVGAQGASKLFESTIGAASKMETYNVTIGAMLNDKQLTKDYTAMMKRVAIDSPVLNLTDMYSSSKSLIAMTKDLGDLEKSFGLVEKLQVLNGDIGTEQAVFSLKEMFQGDSTSMKEVFGLNGQQLNLVKKLAVPEQIKAIEKMLGGMNITDEVVDKLGATTSAQYNSLRERISLFMSDIGADSNNSLGKFLKRLNNGFEKLNVTALSNKIGDALDIVTNKVFDIAKFFWKWKAPISYIAGALTATLGAFAVIGTLSLLANPISLIAGAISGAAVGMVALYNNSETFRNAIDGVVGKAKELWGAFQSGGAGGLLDSLFGEGTAETVKGKIDQVVSWASSIYEKLKPGLEATKEAFSNAWSTVSDIFSNAWGIIQPILSGLSSFLRIIGEVAVIAFNNVILPALQFIAGAFSSLWTIAQPILTLLAGLFDVLASAALALWNVALSPLVNFITTAIKNTFTVFGDVLSTIAGWFEKITGWANTARDTLGKFADKVAGIKLPDWVTNGISTVVKTVGKVIGGKPDGSHYHGLGRVPYDGYIASLHRNEMILTAQEAEQYRSVVKPNESLTSVTAPQKVASNVFNSSTQQEPTYSNVSYEEVSAGITNNRSTTNNTYNTVAPKESRKKAPQPQRSISIAKLAEHIIIREEADVDRIVDKMVAKLIQSEIAGA